MFHNVDPLDKLLQNPDVMDIHINAPDSIFYWHRDEGRKEWTEHFENEAQVRALADELAKAGRVNLSYENPIVELRLEDASRITIIIPPASSRGTVMKIQKAFESDMSFEKLIEYKSISPAAADFLIASVKVAANIVVVGGHSSGKTTILSILAEYISEQARIVAVQPFSTFKVSQKDSVMLETRNPDLNGQGGISAAQLMPVALNLYPDRLIAVDLAGTEFSPLLDAMAVGQRAMFAMEGTSSRDALSRLENYATRGNLSQPLLTIREQMARSLDLIVHIAMTDEGLRRIISIDEVVGLRGDSVELQAIFHRVDGELKATGYVPKMFERIKTWRWADVPLSEDVFKV